MKHACRRMKHRQSRYEARLRQDVVWGIVVFESLHRKRSPVSPAGSVGASALWRRGVHWTPAPFDKGGYFREVEDALPYKSVTVMQSQGRALLVSKCDVLTGRRGRRPLRCVVSSFRREHRPRCSDIFLSTQSAQLTASHLPARSVLLRSGAEVSTGHPHPLTREANDCAE